MCVRGLIGPADEHRNNTSVDVAYQVARVTGCSDASLCKNSLGLTSGRVPFLNSFPAAISHPYAPVQGETFPSSTGTVTPLHAKPLDVQVTHTARRTTWSPPWLTRCTVPGPSRHQTPPNRMMGATAILHSRQPAHHCRILASYERTLVLLNVGRVTGPHMTNAQLRIIAAHRTAQ